MDLAVSVRRAGQIFYGPHAVPVSFHRFCFLPSISKIRVRVPVNRHASEIQFPVN